jgi:dynein heavy chain 1
VFFQTLGVMKRTMENIKDPLFRFFEREVNAGAKLLADVRRDLLDIMMVCQGEKKPTNHHRSMMADLAKGKLNSCNNLFTLSIS